MAKIVRMDKIIIIIIIIIIIKLESTIHQLCILCKETV